jgi:hypothetical protein
MRTPRINLKELKKLKEENFRERLEFIDKYVEWMKRSSNKTRSPQQKDLLD